MIFALLLNNWLSASRRVLLLTLSFAFLTAIDAHAQPPPLHAETSSYSIDIGVVAAVDLRKRPNFIDRHKDFHGDALYVPDMHHLTVAVADRKTGAKIADATVIAAVRHKKQRDSQPVERPLERMAIDDTISYGNFFRMAEPGSYEIALKVYRPQANKPEEAIFTYTKPES